MRMNCCQKHLSQTPDLVGDAGYLLRHLRERVKTKCEFGGLLMAPFVMIG